MANCSPLLQTWLVCRWTGFNISRMAFMPSLGYLRKPSATQGSKKKRGIVRTRKSFESQLKGYLVFLVAFTFFASHPPLWYKADMDTIFKACIIIHDMICNEHNNIYSGTISIYIEGEYYRLSVELTFVETGEGTYEQATI